MGVRGRSTISVVLGLSHHKVRMHSQISVFFIRDRLEGLLKLVFLKFRESSINDAPSVGSVTLALSIT